MLPLRFQKQEPLRQTGHYPTGFYNLKLLFAEPLPAEFPDISDRYECCRK